MIVYSDTRANFTTHVLNNDIEERILQRFQAELERGTSQKEVDSWKNSLVYMNMALTMAETPADARVAIEYQVPPTSKRVDFILTGKNRAGKETAVIVELKQWTDVYATELDAMVETYLGGSRRETVHPSYQAWTYAALIEDFNEEAGDGTIDLVPCAYLHNCPDASPVTDDFYKAHIDRAPVFLRSDAAKLASFLRAHVNQPDDGEILYRIENGRIRPSKGLADHLLSLMQGNPEFLMIDDQKLVYETALKLAATAAPDKKQVLIVEGGPGTGKSVVAINLLVELTQQGQLVNYVSRNAAPRAVYESKLTGHFTKSRISSLFKGSGAYIDGEPDRFDALIVDEAHRLNEKSGLYGNLGENQAKEIVRAAKLSVFFIDRYQRVTIKDVGTSAEIRKWAAHYGAEVTELTLSSQFRCNGSDGYLAWVSDALQIEQTANTDLQDVDYDFRVFKNPNDMLREIRRLNLVDNKARMVAGYCWDWKGKKDPNIADVKIPEYGFAMRWNLTKDGSLWIVSPESVEEIGCIHTCQGLEVDYIGVVIGRDLVVRDGRVVTDALERSSQDSSIRGIRGMLKKSPVEARALADRIIKNTYRTLMTRGQKGCFVYAVDTETNEYFQRFTSRAVADLLGTERMVADRNQGE